MKPKAPKTRNMVVVNMLARRQRAGRHKDRKKAENKKACREKVQH